MKISKTKKKYACSRITTTNDSNLHILVNIMLEYMNQLRIKRGLKLHNSKKINASYKTPENNEF